jgi:HAD superfamily hydrolase (TIGR01509 family)
MLEKNPSSFPWAKDLIIGLKRDHLVGVVSSAPKKPLLRELDRNGLLPHLDVVVSGDDVDELKPSKKPLLAACKKLGIKPKDCIYVGDMVEDIRASKNAGMKSVAVCWGIHSTKKLMGETPDYIAENQNQLLTHLRRWRAY